MRCCKQLRQKPLLVTIPCQVMGAEEAHFRRVHRRTLHPNKASCFGQMRGVREQLAALERLHKGIQVQLTAPGALQVTHSTQTVANRHGPSRAKFGTLTRSNPRKMLRNPENR